MLYEKYIQGVVLLTLCASAHNLEAQADVTKTFGARDTLVAPRDDRPEAQQALDELKWQAGRFTVTATAPAGDDGAARDPFADYDAVITFPSPHPTGDARNDTVVLEWFAARGDDGRAVKAPAMLVLHILDGRMRVARGFARAFREAGIHAFVMHMPHYGQRRKPGLKPDPKLILGGVRQAVADGRRARDAIAALPNIDASRVGIQGTSLGGFICTAIASVDDAFAPVFPTLAGGDLKTLFRDGKNEVAAIRKELARHGITIEQFHTMLERIEPNTLAHRINPKHTWMFNAEHDEVIPAANARALAQTIGLLDGRHVWMSGGHVTCIIHMPRVVQMMIEHIKTNGD